MIQLMRLSSKCEDLFFNSSLNHTSKKFLSLEKCSLFFLSSELGVLVISLLQGKDMAAMDSNGKFNVPRLFLLLIVTLKNLCEILRGWYAILGLISKKNTN